MVGVPPEPAARRSCPRHEAAAGAGVREGIHSARLQQWHTVPVPDQVPRGAGEPGTQTGIPHLLWGEGEGLFRDGGSMGRPGPAQCLAALGRGRQRRSLGQKRATKQDTMLGGGRVRPSPRCDDLIELCGAQCRESVPSHPSSSLLPPHPHPGLLTAVMRN